MSVLFRLRGPALFIVVASFSAAPSPRRAFAEPPTTTTAVRMDRYGDSLPVTALARMGTVRFRQGGEVRTIAYSPNGLIVASAGNDRRICLWDPKTGCRLRDLEGHRDAVLALAFSPDGRILASGSADKTLRLWDVTTGAMLHCLEGHADEVCALAFTQTGFLLASGARDRTVRLWRLGAPRPSEEMTIPLSAAALSLAFSPDDALLAVVTEGWDLYLWEPTAKTLRFEGKHGAGWATCVAFSGDGEELIAAGAHTIVRRDSTCGKKLGCTSLPAGLSCGAAFSPDTHLVGKPADDETVRILDTVSGKQRSLLRAPGCHIRCLAFAPDGKTLAGGGDDGSIRCWNIATEREWPLDAAPRSPPVRVVFSPNGQTVLSSHRDGQIRAWEVASGKMLRQFPGRTHLTGALAISLNGRTLATCGRDYLSASLIDADTGTELHRFADGGHAVSAIDFASRQPMVATGDTSGLIRLWDTRTGRELRRFAGDFGAVFALRFAPDGKRLAAASGIGPTAIRIWDATTGRELSRPGAVEGEVLDLTWSRDGWLLASGGRDDVIRIWEARSGKLLTRMAAGHGIVRSLTFSASARSLFSAGDDGTIRLWEVSSESLRGRLLGHAGVVQSVALAPDGRCLASASLDGTLLVWSVDDLAPTAVPERLSARKLEELWITLAEESVPAAYLAMRTLAATPADAVPFLRDRLLAYRWDVRKINEWINSLDDDRFAVREEASRMLECAGAEVETVLRKVLAAKPTLETARRIEVLLERLETPSLPLGRLRALRALEVLERVDTADAHKVLRALASGYSDTWPAREARASLERLDGGDRNSRGLSQMWRSLFSGQPEIPSR